jgi:hypothetical protein
MTSKKPNLAAVVEAAGSTRRTAKAAPPPALQPSETPPTRPRTRIATRQIAAHFPEEVAWQLRELAVERRTTIQALLGEALNDLFQKHGKAEIVSVEQARTS